MHLQERINKYKVSPKSERTMDGIVFDSKLEMNRWAYLKIMEKAGKISNLRRQVVYVLQEEFRHQGINHRAITYKADIVYMTIRGETIEDPKGMATPLFKAKKKMLLFTHPWINFHEIKNAQEVGGLIL